MQRDPTNRRTFTYSANYWRTYRMHLDTGLPFPLPPAAAASITHGSQSEPWSVYIPDSRLLGIQVWKGIPRQHGHHQIPVDDVAVGTVEFHAKPVFKRNFKDSMRLRSSEQFQDGSSCSVGIDLGKQRPSCTTDALQALVPAGWEATRLSYWKCNRSRILSGMKTQTLANIRLLYSDHVTGLGETCMCLSRSSCSLFVCTRALDVRLSHWCRYKIYASR